MSVPGEGATHSGVAHGFSRAIASASSAGDVLRIIAFSIAMAAVFDPAVSVSGASRSRVALVELEPSSAIGHIVRDRLTRDLSSSYEIVPAMTSDAAAAIVIGDRYPADFDGSNEAVEMPDTLAVATVTLAQPTVTGPRIVRVVAPAEVPPGTVVHLDVELEGRGIAGQTTDVVARVAGLESTRVSHRWTADAERWHAALDIVPIGDDPLVIRVEARSAGEPQTAASAAAMNGSAADVVVGVRRAPLRVQFYDPRPSWSTTFVRRSLEADPRFQVAALGFTSRGVSSQTGGAVALDDPRLDNVDVVVVGGLDRLSAADARSLNRYLRERGGAVVVLPDERIESGPGRDLLEGQQLVERLLEQPAMLAVTPPAASLRASELLVLPSPMPLTDIIARVPGAGASAGPGVPAIVSMPLGDGRLLLSGAMDAWRYRGQDNGAFDRFWQSTIAGLALAVPPPIDVSMAPPLPRPGERVDLTVRVRSRGVSSVSASLDRTQPVRLLPDPEAGRYRGHFVARETPGRSTLTVETQGSEPLAASSTLVVPSEVRRLRDVAVPALAMLASSHRGIDVSPERVADLESFIRRTVQSPRTPIVRHPMRSAWWMLPFAACLSAEWWMRRRRGLR
jgi:hypothetical protein